MLEYLHLNLFGMFFHLFIIKKGEEEKKRRMYRYNFPLSLFFLLFRRSLSICLIDSDDKIYRRSLIFVFMFVYIEIIGQISFQ